MTDPDDDPIERSSPALATVQSASRRGLSSLRAGDPTFAEDLGAVPVAYERMAGGRVYLLTGCDQGWRALGATVLADRSIRAVLADCDRAGRTAAQRIAGDLVVAYATARVVDLAPDREDGYDQLIGWPNAAMLL